MNNTKRYSLLAIMCSLSIVINIIENLFIPPFSFGIRFGLANIVSLITLKKMGFRDMCIVVLLRLTLGNLIKGTIFGIPFWISSLGIILSSIIIVILDKLKTSILFTSMMSSIFHTFGQLLVVCFIYNQANLIILLPTLIITSLATGVLTGLISSKILSQHKLFK